MSTYSEMINNTTYPEIIDITPAGMGFNLHADDASDMEMSDMPWRDIYDPEPLSGSSGIVTPDYLTRLESPDEDFDEDDYFGAGCCSCAHSEEHPSRSPSPSPPPSPSFDEDAAYEHSYLPVDEDAEYLAAVDHVLSGSQYWYPNPEVEAEYFAENPRNHCRCCSPYAAEDADDDAEYLPSSYDDEEDEEELDQSQYWSTHSAPASPPSEHPPSALLEDTRIPNYWSAHSDSDISLEPEYFPPPLVGRSSQYSTTSDAADSYYSCDCGCEDSDEELQATTPDESARPTYEPYPSPSDQDKIIGFYDQYYDDEFYPVEYEHIQLPAAPVGLNVNDLIQKALWDNALKGADDDFEVEEENPTYELV